MPDLQPCLADVVDVWHTLYDPAWADGWDAVGLVCGDPDAPVRRVLFAVDPVATVVDEALTWGADVLVVHHPLLLTPVHSVAATTPKGRLLHRLVREGVALLTAHTNADVPEGGVNDSLARAVGITEPRVLLPTDDTALDKIVTFVPHEHAGGVRRALAEAGAGRIGDYDSCSFTSSGEGRFRPLAGASPTVGQVGELETVPESRIEAVAPRTRRGEVVAAMLAAHPYEEPAYDVLELGSGSVPATRGHGRIGRLRAPTTLRGFAETVAAVLPDSASGVRVAGEPDRPVRTVAVGAGSGDSLLDLVAGTDADVFLTSDLKHHRASEFLERGAQGGPALVDVAHWAAEWTWLPVAEQRLRGALAEAGYSVETKVSTTVTDPWVFRGHRR